VKDGVKDGKEDLRASLADLLEEVRWDYDPARRLASPLLPTARYFEDFPWEGTDVTGNADTGEEPG
jgi:hypothetical protein